MLVVSDVHGAFDALRRVAESGDSLVILGDLANLTDYRTGEGAIADALGIEHARNAADARGRGDFDGMREIWAAASSLVPDVRESIGAAIEAQYLQLDAALGSGSGYVIHGNVDRPEKLVAALPVSFQYVHGQRIVIQDVVFGFVGGGVETPLMADGEIADEEMERLLNDLGPVDVLCTHVPPKIDSLRTDVVTGRAERSSLPVLRYLLERQPKLHMFGDIHQPVASRWRIGGTRCVNVGYFRATGRPHHLDLARL